MCRRAATCSAQRRRVAQPGGHARAVLAQGHQQQPAGISGVDGASHTVHGDARLPNIMARRDSNSNSGFQVLFVDFGWAGVAGRSRYDA